MYDRAQVDLALEASIHIGLTILLATAEGNCNYGQSQR
jgi:hypothetical protein